LYSSSTSPPTSDPFTPTFVKPLINPNPNRCRPSVNLQSPSAASPSSLHRLHILLPSSPPPSTIRGFVGTPNVSIGVILNRRLPFDVALVVRSWCLRQPPSFGAPSAAAPSSVVRRRSLPPSLLFTASCCQLDLLILLASPSSSVFFVFSVAEIWLFLYWDFMFLNFSIGRKGLINSSLQSKLKSLYLGVG
ncbi:hypothetical protein PIB30_045457, partial [Stylosanthes scabra]|nr:hypothetical protein [Stylosanthes scabra]